MQKIKDMKCNINHEDYGLPLESSLSSQIYDALQGNIVEQLMEMAKTQNPTNYFRSILEGHSFKVEQATLPHYYNMFQEIKEQLGFEDNIDFYVTGDSSVNAYSICSMNPEEPNIINVNSSLVELMTDDELRFVIGHEMGHLINGNTKLTRLIDFVYSNKEETPITLQYKIRLWGQLNELIADRYGFLAMPNINVCISAFFKMASGLDFDKMKMNIENFIEDNKKRLDFFRNDKGLNFDVHPVNPIRVEALNIFAKSEFFVKDGTNRQELNNEMDDLISILLRVRNSELDVYMTDYIVSAGIIMSNSDGEMSEKELEIILDELSATQIFPGEFINEIFKLEKDQIISMFIQSTHKILEINPNLREALFIYLIQIMMADKKIDTNEINTLIQMANDFFGYQQVEAANIILEMLKNNFTPNVISLY